MRVPTRQRHRLSARRPAQFAKHARGQGERAAQSVFRAPMRSPRPRDAGPWMRKHAPPSWPVRNRQEFSPNLHRNARIDRETPDACTGLRAVCVPTRPVHRSRAGTRRSSGPERLPGADAQPRGCASTPPHPVPLPSTPSRARSGGVRDSHQAVRRRFLGPPCGLRAVDFPRERGTGRVHRSMDAPDRARPSAPDPSPEGNLPRSRPDFPSDRCPGAGNAAVLEPLRLGIAK